MSRCEGVHTVRVFAERSLMGFLRTILRRITVATVLLPLVLGGCGQSASKLVNPITTGGSIKIDISRSTVPEFSWANGDTVEAITVSGFSPGGTVDRSLWGYRTCEITPPVKYGSELNCTKNPPISAPPLQSGVRYRVEVVRRGVASYADWVVP